MSNIHNRYIQLFLKAAESLKLPYRYNDLFEGVELTFGPHRYILRGAHFPFNDRASFVIAGDKCAMNRLLHRSGFPVPASITFSRQDYLEKTYDISKLPYPIVAKPTRDTSRGYHVICNIDSPKELEKYFCYAFLEHSSITCERFCADLTHYRVLVFYGRVIGVVRRDPAQIIGDGIHTIEALIALENEKRRMRYAHLTMGDIALDQEYSIRLRELGLSMQSIPKAEEVIRLCYNANSSRGGTMTSLAAQICPENAKLFCDAAAALNLNLVGFDVVCQDIDTPITKSVGYIIEANSGPDMTIHETPLFGTPHPVTKIILKRFIRWHPFYYLKHRLHLIIPKVFFNFRLWIVFGALLALTHFAR